MNNDITTEFQQFVFQSASFADAGKGNLGEISHLAFGMVEESGEFAGTLKKMTRTVAFSDDQAYHEHMGTRSNVKKQLLELCDGVWYMQALCNFYRISIEELMIYNVVKLHQRRIENPNYYPDKEEVTWPLSNLAYEDALKLTQHIEYQIMVRNASMCMDIDTLLKPNV